MFTAATINDPSLQLGSVGAKVKELQELLNKRVASSDRVKVDGNFGVKTEAVVKTVQYQFLLKQDGIAGALTWKSLRANGPVDKPILRRPSNGQEITRVQKVLKDGGYYKGAIDGDFGVGTEAALKAFEKDKKLTQDGILDEKTWKALSDLATFLTID